ncbi:MAG TPA: prenyltransferase/squalene oxidase repeat-containing protein [Tepidisphaeraceae bacterium]|nr:prenyltransferase/squalene oxidase repeat-containing protein [Tepidisphaeraceae bacterium]
MKHTTWIPCLLVLGAVFAPVVRAAPPARTGEVAKDDVVVDDRTEALIKGAVKWLAAKQQPNGSWTTGRDNSHPVAMTGYTLMAMMAAGHLPGEGEYGKQVTKGMNYLMSCVRSDGYITNGGESNMYNHGIAAIALAELYGQTRDPKLKVKLEAAIKLIVNCQNNQGGWRYRPAIVDGDISVTVLQLVACRAALNSGIEVPQSTIDKGVSFVKLCYEPKSGGFTYQPRGNPPGFARTAAAIYSLQVCGKYDDKEVATGAKYLLDLKLNPSGEWFTYGNFYAAPAMYMIGGETWRQWYAKMKEQLIDKAGAKLKREGDMTYWDPFDGQGVGPVYATAVYTTILSMPYHYIPLYQR